MRYRKVCLRAAVKSDLCVDFTESEFSEMIAGFIRRILSVAAAIRLLALIYVFLHVFLAKYSLGFKFVVCCA